MNSEIKHLKIEKDLHKIESEILKEKFKTRMTIQVHDELVFEGPEAEMNAVRQMVVSEMEKAIPLNVPVKVDVGIGKSWGGAK